jgi:hypothetical protein
MIHLIWKSECVMTQIIMFAASNVIILNRLLFTIKKRNKLLNTVAWIKDNHKIEFLFFSL